MKLFIVNADDFGESREINKGIIEAFQYGIVRSATILTDMSGTAEAINFAKKNPQFGFGIHINLDKYFLPKSQKAVHLKKNVTVNQVIKSIKKQIKELLDTGIPFDHINGHHHCAMRPTLFPLICKLAKQYRIPAIRYAPGLLARFNYVDTEFLPSYAVQCGIKYPQYFINNISEFSKIVHLNQFTAEFAVHPGYFKRNAWWVDFWRFNDLKFCIDKNVQSWLKNEKIYLGCFRDLP